MDDGDAGAADDERATELSAIAAIYPEIFIDPKKPYSASLDLSVTPVAPVKIRFQQSVESGTSQFPTPPPSTEKFDAEEAKQQALPPGTATDDHDLAHLPALTVLITLPEQYPAEAPPQVRLSSNPSWIPKKILKDLKDDCEKLWEEWGRAETVYTYIDHLTQAAESAFGMVKHGATLELSSDMKLALLDFDLKTKREIFEKETFDCGICLEPKKGLACHRMMFCGHVFCVACLQDFYNNCIKEGDIENVKCMDPGCGKGTRGSSGNPKRKKQDRTINPSELLQIPIEQELVQRYVRMKRKKRLEADQNTIYCPRQWCQGAARSKKYPKPMDPMNDIQEPGSDSDAEVDADSSTKSRKIDLKELPMAERLAICEDCSFAFCCVCKKGWHGETAGCIPRQQAELDEEEQASQAYIKRYSTPCPTCSAPAQKTMGCNHMICFTCRTHFCYLCSSYLMPHNPYNHYNDFKSACYMRLWELENGDGAEVGHGYAGGNEEWEAESNTDSDGDDLEGEDFGDFAGDDDLIALSDDEDTSDDEEPAPDQRRPDRPGPVQIELVNAAGQHIIHNIPERPRPAAPAAIAPPPVARRNRRGVAPQRGRGRRQAPNHRAPPNQGHPLPPRRNMRQAMQEPRPNAGPRPIQAERPFIEGLLGNNQQENAEEQVMVRAAAAPGQGNVAALQPAPVRAMGLERFLELANNDQEDEWDSDELDEDVEMAARARMRRNGRRY